MMCVECVANLVEHMKDAHIRETHIAEGEFGVFLFLSFIDDFVAAKLLSLFSHFLLVSATVSLKKKKKTVVNFSAKSLFYRRKDVVTCQRFSDFQKKISLNVCVV